MRFLFSSIGKKIQIAISGIFLCIFLLFHLGNNITLFFGSHVFNSMVEMLESVKPIIRVMEFSLLGILLLHISNAIYLTKKNKEQCIFQSPQSEIKKMFNFIILQNGHQPILHDGEVKNNLYFTFEDFARCIFEDSSENL